jgi:ABC-2 type transport system ATP-binding protein
MLEGLLKPTRGEIRFRGQPIRNGARLSAEYRAKIGIQFQSTALPDFLTVREVIELFAGFYPNRIGTAELLAQMNLTELSTAEPKQLSGGQRQRLLLALAIVHQPEIVFLDEPTTGLDPSARRDFWDLIRRLKAAGTTLILTTHYMDEAEKLCDDLLIVHQGQLVAEGTPRQLLDSNFAGTLVEWATPDGQRRSEVVQTRAGSPEARQRLSALLGDEAVVDLRVRPPTLDDLFLKLTGTRLDVQEKGAAG